MMHPTPKYLGCMSQIKSYVDKQNLHWNTLREMSSNIKGQIYSWCYVTNCNSIIPAIKASPMAVDSWLEKSWLLKLKKYTSIFFLFCAGSMNMHKHQEMVSLSVLHFKCEFKWGTVCFRNISTNYNHLLRNMGINGYFMQWH